jgi:hypothetical protein
MPRLNGIQFVNALRAMISNLNGKNRVQVGEPNFVFLTAYLTVQFKNHLQGLNLSAHYDKPLELCQLEIILAQS